MFVRVVWLINVVLTGVSKQLLKREYVWVFYIIALVLVENASINLFYKRINARMRRV